MNGFNKVVLAGNLTRDPELRYTPKGTATANVGLAINRKWKDEAGQEREETTFIDIEAWGKQAETLAQYQKKGAQLLVEGRLKLNQWDDKTTGQKRSQIVVVMETMTFLGAPKTAPQGQPGAKPRQRKAA